ncbi:hypothetical protein NC995_10625 [Leptolyngbya sp. FACHB-1515]
MNQPQTSSEHDQGFSTGFPQVQAIGWRCEFDSSQVFHNFHRQQFSADWQGRSPFGLGDNCLN